MKKASLCSGVSMDNRNEDAMLLWELIEEQFRLE